VNGELKTKLYEEIADRIIILIEQGVLKEGDKIPSIRTLSNQLGVSLNTIKESFWYLENHNYIQSIPQSGYYVRNLNDKIVKKDVIDPKSYNPVKVSLCKIYSAFLVEGKCPPEAELGIATTNSDFWPKDKIRKCIQDIIRYDNDTAFRYSMSPGYKPLIEQISLFALQAGININPDEIIITTGCMEAIYLAIKTICKPGDTIAIQTPMFFNFLQLCEELNLNILEIPNVADVGVNIDILKFVIDNYDIKAFLTIPNFNNPSGSCMTDPQKEELVKMIEDANIYLIEDDIYADIYFSDKRPKPCKAFDDSGNVILCSSFSKILVPGLRIGWIAPGKLYKKIEKTKLLMNIGCSTLDQMIVTKFLQDGSIERHLRKLRKILKSQTQNMRELILDTFPEGTKVSDPKGGFVLWVELPKNIDSLKLYELLLDKGIIIAPGVTFSASGKYNSFFRLNAGIWNEKIIESIKYIAETVSSM
jgi:DNA-binding transcriptional MocR family regulator